MTAMKSSPPASPVTMAAAITTSSGLSRAAKPTTMTTTPSNVSVMTCPPIQSIRLWRAEGAAAGCLDYEHVACLHFGHASRVQLLDRAVGADDSVAASGSVSAAIESEGRNAAAVRQDRCAHRLTEFDLAHGAVTALEHPASA